MSKVTYTELIKKISDETMYSESSVLSIMKAYRNIVTDEISKGNNVVIPDFMSVTIKVQNPRTVYDFSKGQTCKTQAKNKVVITPGKKLQNAAPSLKKKGRPKKS